MITGIDPIHELESDGECGPLMGWLLYGDVDHDDIELFMADYDVEDVFPEGHDGGFEVTEEYVRKVPIRHTGGYRYVYSGPGRGARKCVRVETANVARHWCWKHPYEPARTGFPSSQFIDPPWPIMPDRLLWMCSDCARDHSERYKQACVQAVAELRAREERAS